MTTHVLKPAWPQLNRGHRLARRLDRAYAFAEPGGTRLADASAAGIDLGFAAEPERGAGPCGRAVRMASCATGSAAGLPLGDADRTISFLFRPSAADGSTLLGYGDATNNNAFRIYAWTDGTLMCDIWFDNFTTTVTVQDGGWHHAALRVVGRLATWFIDGRTAGSHLFANLNTIDSAGLPFTLGAEPENLASQRYTGWLDAVKVWSRGLSDAEVTADVRDPFAPLRGRPTSPALHAAALPPLAAGAASFVHSGPGGIALACGLPSGGTAPYATAWRRRTHPAGAWADLADGGGVSGAATADLDDGSAAAGTLYDYLQRATDSNSATADSNVVTAQVYTGGAIGGGGTGGPRIGSPFLRGA